MMLKAIRHHRLGSSEIRDLQDRRLRAMVKHSYVNVPYYHHLFRKAGVKPDTIRTTEDLVKIPILTKKILKSVALENMCARNISMSKCTRLNTSGTTGLPLSVYWTKNALWDGYLRNYRFQLECGDKITNRQVDISAGWVPHNILFQRFGIFETLQIPAYANIRLIIERIREFGAATLITLPSFVMLLCKEIKETGSKDLHLPLIFAGGEMILDFTRKISWDVLGAELFGGFGTNELGFVAGECIEHFGYHVEGDSCIVEITKNGERVSPDEEGDVTVTNLTNRATPLLRYNLEDVGMLAGEKCSCGSCFPVMKITKGRKSDFFKTPNGRIIPATTISVCLAPIEGIKQFQVIQEKIDHFVVRITKAKTFRKEMTEAIATKLKEVVGKAHVDVSIDNEIPRGKSRKFTPLVTKIPVG